MSAFLSADDALYAARLAGSDATEANTTLAAEATSAINPGIPVGNVAGANTLPEVTAAGTSSADDPGQLPVGGLNTPRADDEATVDLEPAPKRRKEAAEADGTAGAPGGAYDGSGDLDLGLTPSLVVAA